MNSLMLGVPLLILFAVKDTVIEALVLHCHVNTVAAKRPEG